MGWAVPEFSRRKVDAAGEMMIRLLHQRQADPDSVARLNEAFNVIDNWRAAHGYPLQAVKMALLGRAKRVDGRALVAQRLKRLASISVKLRSNRHMKLSQMQDIGGCRAVMPSPRALGHLVTIYDDLMFEKRRERPEIIEKYNYISTPKDDGYRSVHFVCKYHTASAAHAPHENLRVEIQLRSSLQHAWATAVETVTTFTGEALRSTVGSKPWRRFFALMGSAIAIREGLPAVPGTPPDGPDLTREIRDLSRQLQVPVVLRNYGAAVQQVTSAAGKAGVFLLVLDSEARTVKVTPFHAGEMTVATNQYLAAEKEIRNRPSQQAVLVWVDSVTALRRAYPNYYLDTGEFLNAVEQATGQAAQNR